MLILWLSVIASVFFRTIGPRVYALRSEFKLFPHRPESSIVRNNEVSSAKSYIFEVILLTTFI